MVTSGRTIELFVCHGFQNDSAVIVIRSLTPACPSLGDARAQTARPQLPVHDSQYRSSVVRLCHCVDSITVSLSLSLLCHACTRQQSPLLRPRQIPQAWFSCRKTTGCPNTVTEPKLTTGQRKIRIIRLQFSFPRFGSLPSPLSGATFLISKI